MLLSIYLGTTAVSWVTFLLFSVAGEKKLKRDGYKFVKPKRTFIENLVWTMSIVFKASIPVYNIINATIVLCMGEKIYEYLEDRLLEEGKIYMSKDERANTQPEIKSSLFEKEKNYTDGIQSRNVEKKYEDMSFEEKMAYLEREKEILLSQRESASIESLSDNLKQQETELQATHNPRKK